jgi:succinate dehydrogenase/fumarate reductase flavoprotein subunit
MENPPQVECDVLVIGSGASGMAAAITARHHGLDVLVVEKAALFGGTTAVSGGWLWVPGNPLAAAQGIADDRDAARTYLRQEAGEHFDGARVDAFLRNAPRMIKFFSRNTAVRFVCPPAAPDYHAESPGGVKAGRSVMVEPMDGRSLGSYLGIIRPPLPELTVLGMMLGSGRDVIHFMRATRSLVSAAYVARRLAGHALDVLRYGRGMSLSNGNALAGRLAKSARDLGIPIWLSSPARALTATDGAISGAQIDRDGSPVQVRARRGVVLACGGFSHEDARRKALFPPVAGGNAYASPVPRENSGDGLRMAESQGGAVDDTLPQAAAWVPVSLVPRADGTKGPFPHFIDRAKPGVIAVTRRGLRFVDEARSYHDFVCALAKDRGGEDASAFLVCDHRTIRRYGLGAVRPAPFGLSRHLRSGYLLCGASLEALAASAGIDAKEFAATVQRFNADARQGGDSQFNKGGTPYGRHMGDAFHSPHPCIAPIEKPPFYAVRILAADLGTFAGLRTDDCARVLQQDGRIVPGLYAVGNDMASVMGGGYPGAGAMLGAAMTFGFVAGCDLAGVEPTD